ncbi:mucoidy inhibitor MuiA family protein [Dokdonia ponticola]|uniref:Mucoidy inhibitor MuiA family protein n=1 Tax=Dokdonia ponticola TaxID=2041041 RepID=A0ABV9I257_9FLAO
MKKILLLLAFMMANYAFAKPVLSVVEVADSTQKKAICTASIEDVASSEKKATSDISQVTVYLNGAQIERSSNVLVKNGTTTLIFENLSNTIDENSIQVSGLGEASILSINYGIDYLTKQKNTEAVEALQQEKKELEFSIKKINNRIVGLQKEEEVINLNQKLGSTTQEVSLEKVKALATYYRQRITEIKNEVLDAERSRYELQIKNQDLTRQLSELNITEEKSTGKITLKINSERQATLPLILKYNVANAGWYPIYDLKAKAIDTPLDLAYKAHVYQTTGAAWTDVSLIISTGDPNTNNIKPEVNTKYLQFVNNYYRNSSRSTSSYSYKYNPTVKRVTGIVQDSNGPIPYANVIIKGTSTGVVTDFDGRYTIDIPQGNTLMYSFLGYDNEELPIYSNTMNVNLKESPAALDQIVITAQGLSREKKALGYAVSEVSSEDIGRMLSGNAPRVSTSTPVNYTATGDIKLDGLTTTRFEIKKKYSIPSDGDVTVIEVDTFKIPATYEYFAAPILNENVFLTASIKDWAQYSLLPGEANIYFEGSYAGKTFIDPLATTEALTVSLGVDPNVIIEREQLDNFKATTFMGSQRIVDNKYEIKIKNNKAMSINLQLVDRIPKSQNKEIKVDDIETGDANYDKETGLLKWTVSIDSNSNAEKRFSYEVRYPKSQRINL